MATIHKALPLNGGANLNFDVVGNTTPPTKSKENTIWVNTDVKISKWSLDGREPISPIDGQVWVKTINTNGRISFNALKKNTIDTHLSRVKQWNGSKWTNMAGGVYYDGGLVLDYSNLPTVIDSSLCNEETLIHVVNGSGTSTTEGTVVYTKAYSGAYFGYNVSRFNTDIRDYSLVSMQYTTSCGGSNYYPDLIFVGTEEQIAGVKFTAYSNVNLNGCTQIAGQWGYSGVTEFLADLSKYQDSAVPMYIGCIVGGYNSGANTLTFNNVTYSVKDIETIPMPTTLISSSGHADEIGGWGRTFIVNESENWVWTDNLDPHLPTINNATVDFVTSANRGDRLGDSIYSQNKFDLSNISSITMGIKRNGNTYTISGSGSDADYCYATISIVDNIGTYPKCIEKVHFPSGWDVFTEQTVTLEIPEDVTEGYLMISVFCTDDEGVKAQLYSLTATKRA